MSKEEFYKYGESLGIKVNDLQRLKMLADKCQEDLKPLIHDLWQLWLDFSEVCDMEKDTPFIRKFNEIEKQINHGKNNT